LGLEIFNAIAVLSQFFQRVIREVAYIMIVCCKRWSTRRTEKGIATIPSGTVKVNSLANVILVKFTTYVNGVELFQPRSALNTDRAITKHATNIEVYPKNKLDTQTASGYTEPGM